MLGFVKCEVLDLSPHSDKKSFALLSVHPHPTGATKIDLNTKGR